LTASPSPAMIVRDDPAMSRAIENPRVRGQGTRSASIPPGRRWSSSTCRTTSTRRRQPAPARRRGDDRGRSARCSVSPAATDACPLQPGHPSRGRPGVADLALSIAGRAAGAGDRRRHRTDRGRDGAAQGPLRRVLRHAMDHLLRLWGIERSTRSTSSRRYGRRRSCSPAASRPRPACGSDFANPGSRALAGHVQPTRESTGASPRGGGQALTHAQTHLPPHPRLPSETLRPGAPCSTVSTGTSTRFSRRRLPFAGSRPTPPIRRRSSISSRGPSCSSGIRTIGSVISVGRRLGQGGRPGVRGRLRARRGRVDRGPAGRFPSLAMGNFLQPRPLPDGGAELSVDPERFHDNLLRRRAR